MRGLPIFAELLLRDDRCRRAIPYKSIRRTLANIGDQGGAETRDAGAPGTADAGIDDAVRAGLEQFFRHRLRGNVAAGVEAGGLGGRVAQVVKIAVEVSQVVVVGDVVEEAVDFGE